MAEFSFHPLHLAGACIVDGFYTGDNRGEFTKSFEKNLFKDAGISFDIGETFTTVSSKNVIRGLHFQLRHPQAKLVTVTAGAVWDVMVDLRPGSETFAKWAGIELSAKNHKGLYLPRGFAHGFLALESNTVMLYQCDGAYDASSDTGIRFDDPDIAVSWPVGRDRVICSDRDRALKSLKEYLKKPMQLD